MGRLAPVRRRVLSMLQECRKVDLYRKVRSISEGSYGYVYQAHVVGQPDNVVALKKVRTQTKKRGDGPLSMAHRAH